MPSYCFSYVVQIWQCDTKITIFTDITDAENIQVVLCQIKHKAI